MNERAEALRKACELRGLRAEWTRLCELARISFSEEGRRGADLSLGKERSSTDQVKHKSARMNFVNFMKDLSMKVEEDFSDLDISDVYCKCRES